MDSIENKESLTDKKLVGKEKLTEIYGIMAEKVVANLNSESDISDYTYKMIATTQSLYNQINTPNSNFPRFPFWGGFGGGCV